jgi:unsaturated rhamnogalacturonyl hydrolase
MFAYFLRKGIRTGILPAGEFDEAAWKALDGILLHFVKLDESAKVHLSGICRVAGLGGSPYRDGSYEYYLSEPVVTDDYKGLGPFVMALTEACRQG